MADRHGQGGDDRIDEKGKAERHPDGQCGGPAGREDREPFAVDVADQAGAKRLRHRVARRQGVDMAQRECLRLEEVVHLVGPGQAVERYQVEDQGGGEHPQRRQPRQALAG